MVNIKQTNLPVHFKFRLVQFNREGAKKYRWKKGGLLPPTGNYRYTPGVPAPDCCLFLSQSTDQQILTGDTPEWSDSEAPVQKVTGVYL